MIVAAGLTPAWQQIVVLDALRPGQVNRAAEVHWCASGKVLNVATALAHLGAPTQAVTMVGGPPKPLIEQHLTSLGIQHALVETHWATRICTTVLEQGSGRATELVENAGPVTAEELDRFAEVFAKQVAEARVVVFSGSLPAGAGCELVRRLLAHTRAPAVLDIRGPELLESLTARPLFVKPNRQELGETLGRPLHTDDELRQAMRQLVDGGAQWVVVTQGSEPAWIASAHEIVRMWPPEVDVVNPIGSGDCVAAGIAWAVEAGESPLSAVRLGIAAGAENAGQILPGRLDPERVIALAEQIRVEAA